MKVFRCDHCRHLIFFENVRCVSCDRQLAYLQDLGVVGSLDAAGDNLWKSPIERAENPTYRLCENFRTYNTCNWAIPSTDPHELCVSCRLTGVIPDLSVAGHGAAWFKLEGAKRRLIYTLASLKLPLANKVDDPERGLSFEFKADTPAADGTVLTGHADGVVTINVSEADDPEREKRRVQLHEPYRTVLGHFRHEVGHYYWDRLIRDDPARRADFRDRFGNEEADYADALNRHYETGPPADWRDRFISSYATAHPWEDWAETWAHYLHMIDALETAADSGLSLVPPAGERPAAAPVDPAANRTPFQKLIDAWFPLTYVLNNLNRGLGLPDAYPFVLSEPAIQKLQFVHETIESNR